MCLRFLLLFSERLVPWLEEADVADAECLLSVAVPDDEEAVATAARELLLLFVELVAADDALLLRLPVLPLL